MKKLKSLSIIVFFGILTLYSQNLIANSIKISGSPELKLSSLSLLGNSKAKAIAASCGFSGAGHSSEDFTTCSTTIICNGQAEYKLGRSLCGGTCEPLNYDCPTVSCPNQAINSPTCNLCSSESAISGGTCTVCQNGGCTNNLCNNNAINPPVCDTCPSGFAMSGGTCISTSCTVTNVCGQTFSGTLTNGVCVTSVQNINNSCITSFSPSDDKVNPNGYVDFSWSIAQTPGVGSRCGFVDLTTSTPRPIPGLQNLDPNTDSVRITNIQTTTRFCLVCQFYNLINNSVLGDAVQHQWIRVVRIGED